MAFKCVACEGTEYLEARCTQSDRVFFTPVKCKMIVQPKAPYVYVCGSCGYVQMHVDINQFKSMKK